MPQNAAFTVLSALAWNLQSDAFEGLGGALERSIDVPAPNWHVEVILGAALVGVGVSLWVHLRRRSRASGARSLRLADWRVGVHALALAAVLAGLGVRGGRIAGRSGWRAHLEAGKEYLEQQRYGEAEAELRDALAAAELFEGDFTRQLITLLHLGRAYQGLSKRAEAQEALSTAACLVDLVPCSPLGKAEVLNHAGEVCFAAADYDSAVQHFQRAAGHVETLYGRGDHRVGQFLCLAGSAYLEDKHFPEAKRYTEEALAILQNDPRTTEVWRAEVLQRCGRANCYAGDYGRAGTLLRQALPLLEHVHGSESPKLGPVLQALAEVCISEEQYDEAETLYRRSSQAALAQGRATGRWLGCVLYRTAMLGAARGRFVQAEALIQEAVQIYSDLRPQRGASWLRFEWWNVFYRLRSLMLRHGRYAELEHLSEQMLPRWEQVFADGAHQSPSDFDADLALLHCRQGEFAEARRWLERTLTRFREQGHELDTDGYYVLHGLGWLHLQQGDYAAAKEAYEQARQLRPGTWGTERKMIHCLNALGRVYAAQDDWSAAEGVFNEAVKAARRAQDPSLPIVLTDLAAAHAARGDYGSAASLWTEALSVGEDAYQVAALDDLWLSAVGLASQPHHGLALTKLNGADWVGAWHSFETGLVRESLAALSALSADPSDQQESTREQQLLAQLYVVGEARGWREERERPESWEESPEGFPDPLRSRNRAGVLVELRELREGLAARSGPPAGQVYDLQQVQAALAPDAALIAWLELSDGGRRMLINEHWACVVRSSGPPIWVRVPGSEGGARWTIEECWLARDLRQSLSTPPGTREDNLESLARRLNTQRLGPIEPYLDGVQHLIVLGVGEMAGVPVEALTDRFIVSYAPSATIYAYLRERELSKVDRPTLLAFADPTLCDAEPPAAPSDPSANSTGAASGRGKVDYQALAKAGCGGREERGRLPRLPATRQEAEAVARLFEPRADLAEPADDSEAALDPPSLVLAGDQASEELVMTLLTNGQLGRYRHILFATHCLPHAWCPSAGAVILSQRGLTDPLDAVVNNKRVFDGVISADEVAGEWRGRLNPESVTLSACHTDAGAWSRDESHLTMAQAFFLAGARSVLLSLWQVEDAATALLITRFYENLLGKYADQRGEYANGERMPKAVALNEAKQWLHALPADHRDRLALALGLDVGTSDDGFDGCPYADPYYWSGFILIGDDR